MECIQDIWDHEENELFWNVREDGCGITRCILEVEPGQWSEDNSYNLTSV